DQKRQTLTQTLQEMQQSEAQWSADVEEKQLDAEKKKSDLDKAKLQASVPRDLLSGRQFEENQTALLRTKTEYDKSLDVVRSKRTQVASDRQNILLRIEKARREIARAEEGIGALVLRAPRAGIDFSGSEPVVHFTNGKTQSVKLGPCNGQDCIAIGGIEEGRELAPVVEAKRG